MSTQLWRQFKEGDRDAFEEIFKLYYADLIRFGINFCGSRQRAEDHIQELFLKIWRQRETLDDVQAIRPYLWTSLRRSLMDERSRLNRNLAFPERVADDFSLSSEEFIIRCEGLELQKRSLARAVRSLTPRQQEVLYLKYYEGMSYEEIEEIMSISYQAARNYLSQALRAMRKEVAASQAQEEQVLYLLILIVCLLQV